MASMVLLVDKNYLGQFRIGFYYDDRAYRLWRPCCPAAAGCGHAAVAIGHALAKRGRVVARRGGPVHRRDGAPEDLFFRVSYRSRGHQPERAYPLHPIGV